MRDERIGRFDDFDQKRNDCLSLELSQRIDGIGSDEPIVAPQDVQQFRNQRVSQLGAVTDLRYNNAQERRMMALEPLPDFRQCLLRDRRVPGQSQGRVDSDFVVGVLQRSSQRIPGGFRKCLDGCQNLSSDAPYIILV